MSKELKKSCSPFSCSSNDDVQEKKRRFPKICPGYIALFIALVYIVIMQLTA